MVKYKEFLNENVAVEVLDLMEAIKLKNPMLTFQLGGNRTTFFDDATPPNRVVVKTSLQVHDVNDPDKPIGSIGYDTDEKYWVRSRLIKNEKYGHWNRSQFESKFSKHMKNIVKEAVKALKPLDYEEVKEEHEGNINRQIDMVGRQAVVKANSFIKLDTFEIFPELLHMHNTGYTPANPKVAQAITYAVEHKTEIEKYYRYSPKKVMIWVRPNSVTYQEGEQITQVNSTAELPEELRNKLFVLDITDKGQFVEDVGMKQDTGIYWVLLEEK